MRIRLWWSASVAVMVALAPAAGLEAQDERSGAFHLGGGAAISLVVGNASDFLDGGAGASLRLEWRSSGAPAVGGALVADWVPLEPDTDEGTGARAENTLLAVVAGPTLGARWGPLRPWIGPLAGVVSGRWRTRTRLGDDRGSSSAFAWGGAAGLGLRLGDAGGHPLELQAGASILDTGSLDFARAPSPEAPARPAGLLQRDIATVSLRLGLSLGL